jgi:hypothetical protein
MESLYTHSKENTIRATNFDRFGSVGIVSWINFPAQYRESGI